MESNRVQTLQNRVLGRFPGRGRLGYALRAAGGLLVGCWRVVAAECDFKVVAGAVRSASSSLTRFGAPDEQGFSAQRIKVWKALNDR